MNRKELTKTCVMISNWKKSFSPQDLNTIISALIIGPRYAHDICQIKSQNMSNILVHV